MHTSLWMSPAPLLSPSPSEEWFLWSLIPDPELTPRRHPGGTTSIISGLPWESGPIPQHPTHPSIPPPFPQKPAAVISPEPRYLLQLFLQAEGFAPRDCNFPAPMIYLKKKNLLFFAIHKNRIRAQQKHREIQMVASTYTLNRHLKLSLEKGSAVECGPFTELSMDFPAPGSR